MITHRNIAEWRGKQLVDRDGDKIGKLEDVYVDVETDEPMFGTVKEGRDRPPSDLRAAGRDHDRPRQPAGHGVQDQVKDAPNIETEGEELSQTDESTLYHHYELNYTPPDTESGRRLARR